MQLGLKINSCTHELQVIQSALACVMVSAIDRCKRALVTLIRALATLYGCRVTVTRDSPDAEVRTAYRKVSWKAHPCVAAVSERGGLRAGGLHVRALKPAIGEGRLGFWSAAPFQ